MFSDVDRLWRELMRKVHHQPAVLDVLAIANMKSILERANRDLERIQKHLEEFLETKRSVFPRFYFLSDDELLEILSQGLSLQ
jgi:dynein heavy chain